MLIELNKEQIITGLDALEIARCWQVHDKRFPALVRYLKEKTSLASSYVGVMPL